MLTLSHKMAEKCGPSRASTKGKKTQSISNDMTCYVTVSTVKLVFILDFNGTGIFIRKFYILVF